MSKFIQNNQKVFILKKFKRIYITYKNVVFTLSMSYIITLLLSSVRNIRCNGVPVLSENREYTILLR